MMSLLPLKISLFLSFMLLACGSLGNDNLESYLKNKAIPLEKAGELDQLINAAGDKTLALLGEASHGTHEYYIWRDSISRRLIAEKGFNFIAVEGDFASLFELNRYVKNKPGAAGSAREVLENLDRWPQWMWGNHEVKQLAEWLRSHNDQLGEGQSMVGFYGMDVYDEWTSKEVLLKFLQDHNPEIYQQVKEQYSCFEPYGFDSRVYARSLQTGRSDCSEHTRTVVELLQNARGEFDVDDYQYFYAVQNAMVVKNAEKFYRKSATRRDASSWNSRVHHMHETVNRLLDVYGEGSKGIVWAHNTHIGDARFTEMYSAGNQNIGELSRVHHGPENVFSIGFTTYRGQVKAGASWESERENMQIAVAQRNSVEYLLNQTGLERFYLMFDDEDRTHDDFMQPRGHRAVGVVFNPANEPRQYVNTVLPMRYDAIIFFRETQALNPLID